MNALRLYNQATAGVLAAQALPLLATPSMVIWMLSTNPPTVTPLEALLARSLGLGLLLIAFLTLLFSGEVQRIYGEADSTTNALETLYGVPTLGATLVYHFATGIVFYSYSYNTALSSAWLTLGSLTHLGLGAGAMMLLMFGKQAPRLSKRTGADKRTSGFPFGNKEADKRKKR